ncbi:MAG: hypothetical protein EB059_07140 [Alphaproteobacteria bacterium]|nr:hypothetical protein [Alphaproteobacteria bacterium]
MPVNPESFINDMVMKGISFNPPHSTLFGKENGVICRIFRQSGGLATSIFYSQFFFRRLDNFKCHTSEVMPAFAGMTNLQKT